MAFLGQHENESNNYEAAVEWERGCYTMYCARFSRKKDHPEQAKCHIESPWIVKEPTEIMIHLVKNYSGNSGVKSEKSK